MHTFFSPSFLSPVIQPLSSPIAVKQTAKPERISQHNFKQKKLITLSLNRSHQQKCAFGIYPRENLIPLNFYLKIISCVIWLVNVLFPDCLEKYTGCMVAYFL